MKPKKKLRPKYFYDELYKVNFYLYIGVDYADFLRELKGRHGIERPEYYDRVVAGKTIIVVHKDWKQWPVLLHEVNHATNWILNERGIELTNESEEAFTYYAEWLLNSIVDVCGFNPGIRLADRS